MPSSEKILFEKRYPCNDINNTEYYHLSAKAPEIMMDQGKIIPPDFEEIMAAITKDITYHPIPMRLNTANEFVETAVKISTDLQIDAKISQGQHYIKAKFDVLCGICMVDFKPLFSMADDFTIWCSSDSNLFVSITFMRYTHVTMKGGRVIRPIF